MLCTIQGFTKNRIPHRNNRLKLAIQTQKNPTESYNLSILNSWEILKILNQNWLTFQLQIKKPEDNILLVK